MKAMKKISSKIKIDKIVVVEGKSDTLRLRKFFNVDTIETKGLANSEETMEKIILAHKNRGVIILTDPDHAGDKIRKEINKLLIDCEHIFLSQDEARGKNGKIGVEYASEEVLRKSFKYVYKTKQDNKEAISLERLIEEGLISGNMARYKRVELGKKLKIGYTNGKQLYNSLKIYNITTDQFDEALSKIKKTII